MLGSKHANLIYEGITYYTYAYQLRCTKQDVLRLSLIHIFLMRIGLFTKEFNKVADKYVFKAVSYTHLIMSSENPISSIRSASSRIKKETLDKST